MKKIHVALVEEPNEGLLRSEQSIVEVFGHSMMLAFAYSSRKWNIGCIRRHSLFGNQDFLVCVFLFMLNICFKISFLVISCILFFLCTVELHSMIGLADVSSDHSTSMQMMSL